MTGFIATTLDSEILKRCPTTAGITSANLFWSFSLLSFGQLFIRNTVVHILKPTAHHSPLLSVSLYKGLQSWKPPWPIYPSLYLWKHMFTWSRHPLCPTTIYQLSPNSASTPVHPYVMKFAAQESRLRQSCFCQRESPQPPRIHQQHHVWASAYTDKPPGFRPNAAATHTHKNKRERHRGYFYQPRCPKTEK